MKGLILVELVTFIGAAAALRWPLYGLYVYVGLAVLRPQFLFGFAGDMSGLSQIVGYAVLLGWAFNGFGSWRTGRGKIIVSLYLTYLAWFVLSAIFALDTSRSWSTIVEVSKLALPFFVGVTMMKDERDWRPMLWTIVLCQGYVAFEMNLDYLFKGFNVAGEGFGGMDNNCFGVSLVTLLGPALALMLSSKAWYARAAAGVSAALIFHTIMLTFSRGAMVGLIVVGVVIFVMLPKRPAYIAALLLVAALAVKFTGPQLLSRYESAFTTGDARDGSAQSRVDLWRDCLRVVGSYPLLGVGPANWRVIAAQYGWPPGKSAHSVWMETAAELGVPGTLLLLLLFLWPAVRLWPIARTAITEENRYHVVLASGVILAIVGFVVAGQFVSVPGLEPPYYMLMLGAAMMKKATPQEELQPAKREPTTPKRITQWSPDGMGTAPAVAATVLKGWKPPSAIAQAQAGPATMRAARSLTPEGPRTAGVREG